MRSSRTTGFFLLLASLTISSLWFSTTNSAAKETAGLDAKQLLFDSLITSYHAVEEKSSRRGMDQGTGIKEQIPAKYLPRYNAWKNEFLATDAGRNQWAFFEKNPNFLLTIEISRDNAEGATTGKYKWSDAGELVAATITLGIRLNAGYPNPIYFPVMNSLIQAEQSSRVDGDTLAAAKIAHEFGHVNRTLKIDADLYQRQAQLIPQYNKIFLSNGRNASDPRLLELAQQIGGTPVEVWEDREYWGEANAMAYLRDRFTEDSLSCAIFTRIRHSVDLYAKSYEPRFIEIAQAAQGRKICGWQ